MHDKMLGGVNDKNKCSVLLVAESWLQEETIIEYEKKLNMNVYMSNRVDRVGGGALIATSKEIVVERQWKFSDEHISLIGIYSPNANTTLVAVYLAPNNDYKTTMLALDNMKRFIKEGPEDSNVVLYGDWNLNALTYEWNQENVLEPIIVGYNETEDTQTQQSHVQQFSVPSPHSAAECQPLISTKHAEKALCAKLIDIVDGLNLDQIVSKPTFRKSNNEKSYLDRIFTNIPMRTEV